MKCILCGCTDRRACMSVSDPLVGCSWLSKDPPICTTHIPELVVDALRWRALMSSDRMSLLGTGGKGSTMHIGLEIWGRHPKRPGSIREAQKLLTKYADDRRKEGYR